MALVSERRPDIVLLDFHLPGMDGYQVVQRLRDIPVIALPADDMPHDVQRRLAAGFDRDIAKTVSPSLLHAQHDLVQCRVRRDRAWQKVHFGSHSRQPLGWEKSLGPYRLMRANAARTGAVA